MKNIFQINIFLAMFMFGNTLETRSFDVRFFFGFSGSFEQFFKK